MGVAASCRWVHPITVQRSDGDCRPVRGPLYRQCLYCYGHPPDPPYLLSETILPRITPCRSSFCNIPVHVYVSVARDLPFWRRFGEMLLVSLGIAAISFMIGILIRVVLEYHSLRYLYEIPAVLPADQGQKTEVQ